MTWPSSDVVTTAMDAGSDTPPRAEILSWAQKFNQLRNHVTTYMQGVLSAANAADARTALGALSKTMNTARLLGRTTAAAGDVEEIIPSGGLSLASGNLTVVDASATVAGKVELATSAETQTGTDAVRAVTPAGLAASALGMGQTWQNMIGSRSLGVSYTNTTGRPIVVSVRAIQSSGASSSNINMQVGSVAVAWSTTIVASVAINSWLIGIVPPGAAYFVAIETGSMGLTSWSELR